MTMQQQQHQQFGDTTLTKLFVGGLAWETDNEVMRDHFGKYGEILEAVIISDKITGRSKGYGFVTFKEAKAAEKACEDATPVINGRRANCNLAWRGARRARSSSPEPGSTNRSRAVSSTTASGSVHWNYPTGRAPALFSHQQGIRSHAYGYSPAYYQEMAYNQMLGYCGPYMYGQFYPGQGMVGPSVPIYPYFHIHHQSQGMGMRRMPAARIFPPTVAGPVANIPTLISKPPSTMTPNKGTHLNLWMFDGSLRQF